MIFILKVLILFGLAKLLEQIEKPFLCAGLYTAIFFVIYLLLGTGLMGALINAGILLVFASFYFWLLNRLIHNMLYWPVFAVGLVIGFV